MKKNYLLSIVLIFISFYLLNAQIFNVNTSLFPEELVQNHLLYESGQCETSISVNSPINGSFNTPPLNSYGAFTASGNSSFSFNEGIILSTGSASHAANTGSSNQGSTSWAGSSLYESTLGLPAGSTFNATEIEFTFLALQNNIIINYVFASEEYSSSNTCTNSDGVLILIKPAGSPDSSYTNIALTPNGDPVTIATIHEAQTAPACPDRNGALLAGARGAGTPFPNYAQYTSTLQAETNSVVNERYTVKIIVADDTDQTIDSAVLIEKINNSLLLELGSLEGATFKAGDVQTCSNLVTLTPSQNYSPTVNYLWTSSIDASFSSNSRTIDVSDSGDYTLQVSASSGCSVTQTINITISDINTGNSLSDLNECTTSGTTTIFDLTQQNSAVLSGRTSSTVEYFTSNIAAESNTASPIANPSNYTGTNGETIFARTIEQPAGCKYISNFVLNVGQGTSISSAPRNFVRCDVENVFGSTVSNADGFEGIFPPEVTGELFAGIGGTFVYYEDSALTTPFDDSRLYTDGTVFYAQNISDTGCESNAILITFVLDTPPNDIPFDEVVGNVPIFEEIIICDETDGDKDGFATFNLLPQGAKITNPGVSITYHESVTDAQNNTREITNPAAYRNTQVNIQEVAIRVVKNGETCPIIRPFLLKPRHLITDSVFENVVECDTDDDGFAVFDLSNKKADISPEFTVEFFRDEAATMPIADSELTAFTNETINSQTIHVRLTDDDPVCSDMETFQLVVAPRVVVNTPPAGTVVNVCDADTDGQVDGLVTIFNNEIAPLITTNPSIDINYFTSQTEANDPDGIAIDNTYVNTASATPVEYYAKASSLEGCFAVVPFMVDVNPAPEASIPTPIMVCYDRNISIPFQDLSQNLNEVIPAAEQSEYTFTYYTTEASARIIPATSTDLIPTTEVTAYDLNNDGDYIIWIRVENNTSGCVSVVNQVFNVNTIPIVADGRDFLLCIDAGDATQADFNLESRDAILLGDSQPEKSVKYYNSSAGAIASDPVDEIDKTTMFSSSTPKQTIFFRIENTNDANCFITDEFDLKIEENAPVRIASNLVSCDNEDADIGRLEFNLQQVIDEMTNNGSIPVKAIRFYATADDAGFLDPVPAGEEVGPPNGTELPLLYTNVSPLSQEIIARVENTNSCVTFQRFILIVREKPLVAPIAPIETCDVSGNGRELINLTQVEASFDFSQNIRPPSLASSDGILYFKTEADRDGFDPSSNRTEISDAEKMAFEVTSPTSIQLSPGFLKSFKEEINL